MARWPRRGRTCKGRASSACSRPTSTCRESFVQSIPRAARMLPDSARLRAGARAVALVLALLATPAIAKAQQPSQKVYRVGVLANALETADGPLFEAFLDGLGKLGYVEDQNIIVEWRSSEGD